MLCECRAAPALSMLSPEEEWAEEIVHLMALGRLNRSECCRRMNALWAAGQNGQIAACYASYLLLRAVPASDERDVHWAQMVARLRAALD